MEELHQVPELPPHRPLPLASLAVAVSIVGLAIVILYAVSQIWGPLLALLLGVVAMVALVTGFVFVGVRK